LLGLAKAPASDKKVALLNSRTAEWVEQDRQPETDFWLALKASTFSFSRIDAVSSLAVCDAATLAITHRQAFQPWLRLRTGSVLD
jgi:hypothetical protein